MKRRKDTADGTGVVDSGLELRFSAQPGPVFVPGSSVSVPAEVVAGIRQMLTRLVTSGQWPRAVALTAALREEGVTHTALALSAVLSQDTTRPVCLVDTNWYWPPAWLDGGLAQSGGLAAVLDGRLALEQALAPVRIADDLDEARLALLPAGQMPHGRRVIAARSPELKAIIARLRERFDYIVLDVPAVLATSDAIALADLADGCCLVVHQGVTPAASVQEARAAIRHLPVIGVIMNHVNVRMPAGLAAQLTQG
jgi:Mrp family chromosome partitioning ATPase